MRATGERADAIKDGLVLPTSTSAAWWAPHLVGTRTWMQSRARAGPFLRSAGSPRGPIRRRAV